MTTSTPKNEKIIKKEISFKNEIYLISIENISDKLSIDIEEKTDIGIVYSNSYTKDELYSTSSFFKMFSIIDDMIPSIFTMIKNDKFSISLSDNILTLEIYPKIENVNDIKFILKQKDIETNELIKKLIYLVKNYEKENNEVKKELSEIKEKFKKYESKKEEEEKKINNLFKETTLLTNEQKLLISDWILKDTEKEFNLLYKFSRDGTSSNDFYSRCDKKGATVTIIQSKAGYKFGGYTSVDWDSSVNNYKKDSLAFLFSLNKKQKYPINKNNEGNAIWTGGNYGPIFGGHDLCLYADFKGGNHYCNKPISYQTKEASELNGGQYNFSINEMEVYQVNFI